jgi:phosphoribosyl-AMP cyclohydrolase
MDDSIESVPGLEPELVERIVRRLRELEPTAIAILVSGSYAKGTADESSDLDVQVVTQGEPVSPYRMWFEERSGAEPLHVSPSAKSLDGWLAKRDESQGWALGFPVFHVVRYLWATEEARTRLGDPPSNVHPPSSPELEDFVEFVQKVRRCADVEDGIAARIFARAAALLVPRLLMALNDEVLVRDRREALGAALSFRVAPAHYRADLSVCLGLVPADDDAVAEAALRLGRELLAFLRERGPEVDDQPDIVRYLADGTLERHLGFATD